MFTIFLDPPKSDYRPEWSINVCIFPGIIVSYLITPFKRYKNNDNNRGLGYMAAVSVGAGYTYDYTVFPACVSLQINFLSYGEYGEYFYKPISVGTNFAGKDCDSYSSRNLDQELIYWEPKMGIWTSKHWFFNRDDPYYYDEGVKKTHPIINTDNWEFFTYEGQLYLRDLKKLTVE